MNQEEEIKKLKEERDKYKKLSEYNLKKLKEDVEKDKKFKEQLKQTMTSMVKSSNDELYAKKQEELEEYWHFNFNKVEKTPRCFYEFFKALKLYENFCRRWEEHHNGSMCVVERVRDTYLKPKIKQFIEKLQSDKK